MRPKVVAAILIIACAILGIAVFLSRPDRPEPGSGGSVSLPAAPAATNPSPAAVPAVAVSTPAPMVVTNEPPAVPETNHAVYVQERNAELMALAMNNDSNSLNTIWSELANPDKAIRAGALAAVVQFGDRSVVPRLRNLAAQTEDPAEKADIIAAADFLALPPLTDLPPAQNIKRPQSKRPQ